MSHVVIITLVLPFTKLLIIISIKCQAFSPVKHILSPRMCVLHGRICILYLYACTSIQNLLLTWGPHLAKQLSASILSFLVQLIDLPFPFFSQKSPAFYCEMPWLIFPSFFKPFSGKSFS